MADKPGHSGHSSLPFSDRPTFNDWAKTIRPVLVALVPCAATPKRWSKTCSLRSGNEETTCRSAGSWTFTSMFAQWFVMRPAAKWRRNAVVAQLARRRLRAFAAPIERGKKPRNGVSSFGACSNSCRMPRKKNESWSHCGWQEKSGRKSNSCWKCPLGRCVRCFPGCSHEYAGGTTPAINSVVRGGFVGRSREVRIQSTAAVRETCRGIFWGRSASPRFGATPGRHCGVLVTNRGLRFGVQPIGVWFRIAKLRPFRGCHMLALTSEWLKEPTYMGWEHLR